MSILAGGVELRKSVMEPSTQQMCEDKLYNCLQTCKTEISLSQTLKEELDRSSFGPGWNVVVGRDFGSYFKHKSKFFSHYRVGQLEIIIWK